LPLFLEGGIAVMAKILLGRDSGPAFRTESLFLLDSQQKTPTMFTITLALYIRGLAMIADWHD
jgi:hypothetical protein